MPSHKRLLTICAVLLGCNVTFLSFFVNYKKGPKCFVSVNHQSNSLTEIPETFLSFGIDASQLQNFETIDFTSSKFKDVAEMLSPAHLRLGGTMSERLIFSHEDIGPITCDQCHGKNSKKQCGLLKKWCKHKFLPFFIMTASKWAEINNFCRAAKLKLLFSFNVLLRNENGWSDQNAKEILNYSKAHNYDIDWQLGNEPNSFRHTFNISLSPEQLSRDFKRLHHILKDYGYEKSLIVGPDTTRPQPNRPECLQYMVDFLGNASNYINVRSWHQYYLNSRTAELDEFWSPNTFALLEKQIETMSKSTKKYFHIPMWLSETSTSYGGGAPGLSDTFAGSPLWLDKLGLSAKNNISTVIRQSLYGGNYSLIDKNYEPLPDWWLSLLFKRIVGSKVLNVDCQCSENQRLYIHCASSKYTTVPGSLVLYGINLEMKKVRFLLNGTALTGENLDIDEFILSAPSNNRKTKTILLNGWPLYYESPLPDLKPRVLKYGRYVSMPPYSIAFWVIKNTSITICNKG